MIPSIDIILPDGADPDAVSPSLNYKMNIKNKTVVGITDELDAMKQVVYKILSTERYENIIYSWEYGLETLDLIGMPYDYVCANLESRIAEALLQDERITDVSDFEFSAAGKNQLLVSFSVSTIFGSFNSETEVSY